MPNNTVPAAGEAMPQITRRFILGGLAVMAAPVAVASPVASPRDEHIDPVQLAEQMAQRLAEAMKLVSPGGDWDVVVNHKTRCAIIVDKVRGREDRS